MRICHPCFPTNTLLKHSMSLKPRPSRSFDSLIFAQDTQWIFLPSPFWPHQNLESRLLICLHKEEDILKQDMVYMVIADTTVLMRTSTLPLLESSLFFHSAHFLAIRSLMDSKAWHLDFGIESGRPRNLSWILMVVIFKKEVIISLREAGVFGLKKIEDFPKLMVLSTDS